MLNSKIEVTIGVGDKVCASSDTITTSIVIRDSRGNHALSSINSLTDGEFQGGNVYITVNGHRTEGGAPCCGRGNILACTIENSFFILSY